METIVYYPKHVYPPIRLHGVMAQKPMVAYEFPFCMRIRQLMNACKHMILAYRAIELVHLIFLCIKRSPVPKYRTSFVYLSCTDRTLLLKCLWYSQFDRTNDNGSKDGMNKCLWQFWRHQHYLLVRSWGKMALHSVVHASRHYKTSDKTSRWDAMRDT